MKVKKNKILFLLGDIWSLGKNKGMPSVFKILEKSQQEFDITIFTTDKNKYCNELPDAEIYYFRKLPFLKCNNRYILYLYNRLNNIYVNLKYIYKYIRLRKKYDIIYCSSSIPIYATYFIKKVFKVKTIHRIYGTFLYHKLGNKFDALKKFEEVLSFRLNADKYIITDDGTMGDKVAEYFNIDPRKILFIKNGVTKISVDKNEIKNKFKIKENSFYCLCVSRLTNWKRVDRIISAFNKITNDDIFLYVVGDGEEKEKLKSMAKNKNIIFLGALSSYEVHGLMQVCDVFISMYDVSNIGNPLLEALTYGMPIITYNSGNTKEVINGSNGILIDETEESKIINKLYLFIMKLYRNPDLRMKMRKGAKKYTESQILTWDKRIEIELKAIRDVINEK